MLLFKRVKIMTIQLQRGSVICLFTLNLNESRCLAAGSQQNTVTGRRFQKLVIQYGI